MDGNGRPDLIEWMLEGGTTKKGLFYSKDITWDWNYYKSGDTMPYGIFTPSNADKAESLPMIVWLHGTGGVSKGERELLRSGLPYAIKNNKLEGFGAYILCPQLTNGYSGTWSDENATDKLQAVLDKVIQEYNIDTNNVVITGHSLGGIGALYMAHNLSSYFSKCAVFSGYYPGFSPSEITMPTICYVGTNDDKSCIRDAEDYFKPAFGEENVFYIEANHTEVPKLAYTLDNGEFNRSCTGITAQT